MQIKYLNNGLVKHVKNEIGAEMVAAGLAIEVAGAIPQPLPGVVTWRVLDGPREGDFQHGPEIYAYCSKCGTKTWQGSKRGTAHQTITFRHCSNPVPETVPADIVEEYERRWKAYKNLSRR